MVGYLTEIIMAGRPEPTSLPPKKAPTNNNNMNAMSSISSHSAGGKGAPDPNGMERLPGESDADYIARQTRLRDEAKARMAAKFGRGGMGGVGSGGECFYTTFLHYNWLIYTRAQHLQTKLLTNSQDHAWEASVQTQTTTPTVATVEVSTSPQHPRQ